MPQVQGDGLPIVSWRRARSASRLPEADVSLSTAPRQLRLNRKERPLADLFECLEKSTAKKLSSDSHAIKYHGGKSLLADRIVGLMPPRCRNPKAPAADDPGYLHYVEPYCGGGAVLLA